jgi:hypothetical protein
MIKDESMPFPTHWTQVFVSWERMLEQHGPDCRQILNWIENEYLGVARYQLRGPNWEPTSGFLFYFEDARDAEVFILKWL